MTEWRSLVFLFLVVVIDEDIVVVVVDTADTIVPVTITMITSQDG